MSGGIGKYYNVPSFDEFKKSNGTAAPTLKPGLMRSSARMSGAGVGKMVYSQNPRKVVVSRGMRNNYPKYGMSQGLYIYKSPKPVYAPKPKPAPPKPLAAISNPSNTTAAGKQYQSQIAALTASLKTQQQQATAAQQKQAADAQQQQAAAVAAAQKTYQSQISEMQGLFASDLQKSKDQFGLQIKGLETGYGNQIAGLQGTISDNAAAYQQNIADQATQFKTQQQTMLTNQERARQAGATPRLRLQEAQDMKQAGTKNFKKRFGSQFNPTAYGSLASIKSGTLNI